MSKIIYDNIIFSLQRFGGISTYWYELAHRILKDEQFEVSFLERENYNSLNFNLRIPPRLSIKTNPHLPLLFHRFRNPKLVKIDKPFVFHSSFNRISTNCNARNVTTVHDLIHHKYYSGLRRILHNSQKAICLNRSNAIIAVSENTRRDLLHYFPRLNPESVHVVYNGVSEDFYPIRDPDYLYKLTDDNINSNYLLCFWSSEKYKNFNLIIDILRKLPDFKLFIVGPALNSEQRALLESKIPKRFEVFSNVSSKILNELYNNAYALVYPSSYEGFGLPLLEAMRASCPFVALNSSSIPEVAGKAGILIDELNVTAFVNSIESIYHNREVIVQRGLKQSENFSWNKCYYETSKIYRLISSE